MNIVLCTNHSEEALESAYDVINFIKEDTQPEEFEDKIKKFPTYTYEKGGRCGWNALGMAAMVGNLHLAKHLVMKGGNHLLNLGNSYGVTPLFCSMDCTNKDKGFLVAKELIVLGANINIATTAPFGSSKGRFPKGATPLWIAAEKTKSLDLVKLLIKHGADDSSPKFSMEGKALILLARKQLEEEKTIKRLFLAAIFKKDNDGSVVKTLPYELIKEILSYL